MEEVVVIVGAGPSGLATSACLNLHSIPNIILEREDCCASLWKKRSYDCLKLHVAKEFCELPFMPHPPSSPTFILREGFIHYMEEYVLKFQLNPKYCRWVESATYDGVDRKWHIEATNTLSNEVEVYIAKFLVIATGENSEGLIPKVPGLESFRGEKPHSSQYKSGQEYRDKDVLVVGCGNSGMVIAYDLSNFGAKTSIVVRSPLHVLNKEMVYMGMRLLKFFPCHVVDTLVMMLARLRYGDLSKYGLLRPEGGPFYLKATTGRPPVIDVGTVQKIQTGGIKVFPAISSINEDEVLFESGKKHRFDAIIFSTGYKSTASNWLKDYSYIFNKDGMPKNSFPDHWKGENGLYCAGLSRRGLAGISMDAKTIADDIMMIISMKGKKAL